MSCSREQLYQPEPLALCSSRMRAFGAGRSEQPVLGTPEMRAEKGPSQTDSHVTKATHKSNKPGCPPFLLPLLFPCWFSPPLPHTEVLFCSCHPPPTSVCGDNHPCTVPTCSALQAGYHFRILGFLLHAPMVTTHRAGGSWGPLDKKALEEPVPVYHLCCLPWQGRSWVSQPC